MPRKVAGARTQTSPVWLPDDLMAKVSLLLLDPRTGRTRWGAWQTLVQALVTNWVEEQQRDPRQSEVLRNTDHRNQAAIMAALEAFFAREKTQ